MDKPQNGKLAKGEFHAQLKKRAEVLYESVIGITDKSDAIAEIFDEFKDVSLQSWNNCISMHKRRAEAAKNKTA